MQALGRWIAGRPALTFATWLWLRGRGEPYWPRWPHWPGYAFTTAGWALLAMPLIWILGRIPADLPRWRWAFLGYYVGHLVVLATISGGMDVAGNLADPAGDDPGSTRTVDQ